MINKLVVFLFLIILPKTYSCRSLVILPDSEKTDTTALRKKHSKFKIEIDYSSNNTYRGRQDTSKLPVLMPYLKYTTRSKFFFKARLYNTGFGKTIFDELDLGLGKKFTFSKKWDGSLSYTHYLFNSNVTRIKAAVQNDINAYLGYDWNILYSQVYFDINKGNDKFKFKGKKIATKNTDYTVIFANSHDFTIYDLIKDGNDLTIMPEADITFGTQHFLAAYSGKSDLVNKKYQKQVAAFNLTSFIFTLDVSYNIKNFTIDFAPYYTIPQNVPTGNSSTPYFVMTASLYYTFTGKK